MKLPAWVSVPKIIEYGSLFAMVFGVAVWVDKTVATKTDVLIAMNLIEAGRIASDMVYYERIGVDNLTLIDKERFKMLELEEDTNDKQHRKLLGLD